MITVTQQYIHWKYFDTLFTSNFDWQSGRATRPTTSTVRRTARLAASQIIKYGSTVLGAVPSGSRLLEKAVLQASFYAFQMFR